eukprot:3385306-Amphidinium_carterae.2
MAVSTRYDPNKPTTIITPNKKCVGEVDDIANRQTIPKQLCQPPQPTKQEQEQHQITHMPCKEQSLIQLDYAASLCVHKVQHSHKQEVAGARNLDLCGNYNWTMHGNSYIKERSDQTSIDTVEEVRDGEKIGQSIVQVDNEPAIKQLAEVSARELTIQWRQSSSNTHQGQESVQRFHQTLFTQVRAIRFDIVDRYKLQSPDNVPQALLFWVLQHACFTINSFGEVVSADIKPITVNKLDIRNKEQKTEGMWLGKQPTVVSTSMPQWMRQAKPSTLGV